MFANLDLASFVSYCALYNYFPCQTGLTLISLAKGYNYIKITTITLPLVTRHQEFDQVETSPLPPLLPLLT